MFNLVAYVDGGSLGNPGPAGIGVVIDGGENGTIKITKPIGHQDNNVAEYLALLEALQCALELGAKTLHVFSDSQVVVKQMIGEPEVGEGVHAILTEGLSCEYRSLARFELKSKECLSY